MRIGIGGSLRVLFSLFSPFFPSSSPCKCSLLFFPLLSCSLEDIIIIIIMRMDYGLQGERANRLHSQLDSPKLSHTSFSAQVASSNTFSEAVSWLYERVGYRCCQESVGQFEKIEEISLLNGRWADSKRERESGWRRRVEVWITDFRDTLNCWGSKTTTIRSPLASANYHCTRFALSDILQHDDDDDDDCSTSAIYRLHSTGYALMRSLHLRLVKSPLFSWASHQVTFRRRFKLCGCRQSHELKAQTCQ